MAIIADGLAVVDEMISETLANSINERMSLAGGHQGPFDGAELGLFIRFAILYEVRDRLTGEDHTEPEIINIYHRGRAHRPDPA